MSLTEWQQIEIEYELLRSLHAVAELNLDNWLQGHFDGPYHRKGYDKIEDATNILHGINTMNMYVLYSLPFHSPSDQWWKEIFDEIVRLAIGEKAFNSDDPELRNDIEALSKQLRHTSVKRINDVVLGEIAELCRNILGDD